MPDCAMTQKLDAVWQPSLDPEALVAERSRRAWRRGCSLLAAVVGLLLTTACGTLPARDPPPALAEARQLARQVTVQGARGPVSAATQARTLAAVQAEGKADLATLHLGVLAATGDVDLYRGNTARLLVDGPATFAAMKAAIGRVRGRLLLESYIMEDAGIAAEFGELLRRKAAEGVRVALMYDSVGSIGSDPAFFAGLEAAGVAVCAYNPVNPLKRPGYWGINQRNHRKLLVADAEVAFTGGINISQVYSSGSGGSGGGSGGSGFGSGAGADASDEQVLSDGWRDTQIELRGPVVAALAQTFVDVWQAQGCRGALGEAPAPAQPSPGQRVVKVVTAEPSPDGQAANRIYSSLLAAIDASQRSVHLTMAYFAPGDDMVQALCDAARRGVEVRLVLPGRSDFPLVLHAGRYYYDRLLHAGVKIHEMDHAVMHAKTAVIDGVFSTVGSSNMDWRSFVSNRELNVIVLGDDFGQELEALFRRDLAVSRPIDAAEWRRRGVRPRVMEQIGRVAERLL